PGGPAAGGPPTDRASRSGRVRRVLAVLVFEIRPGRDVDAVVLGRSERPPMGRVCLIGQASTRGDSRRDPCLRLIGGHADVYMRTAAAMLGTAQALERDVWIASV